MTDATPVVLVTGATSGLGRYLVRELADSGWQVLALGQATLRLVTDPALDGVTGQFFDGLKTARARPEAYDPRFRARLREVTGRLLGKVA